jgi:hypothetical protein
MIRITRRTLPRLVVSTALLLWASLAHAQYAWVDEKGIHHFSDRPPPPATPASRILKAPGKPSVAELLQESQPDPKPAAEAKPVAGKATLAEREADYRKRSQEREKLEQKAAAEARHKQALAENCDTARRYKGLLDSGIRVADTGADGERTFISDEERALRLAKTHAILSECQK